MFFKKLINFFLENSLFLFFLFAFLVSVFIKSFFFWLIAEYALVTLFVYLEKTSQTKRVSLKTKEKHFSLRNFGESTFFAVLLYAVFLAIIVTTIRDARGFFPLRPFNNFSGTQIPAELLTAGTTQSVYDKSFIKLVLISFFLSFSVSVFWIAETLKRFSSLKPRMETAIFCIVVFFAFCRLPLYNFDLTHWASWLGPAVGVMAKRFPYFHTHTQYGFWSSVLLAFWIQIFKFTPITLAAFVLTMGALASLIAFVLLNQITKSRWFSLLITILLIYAFIAMESDIYYPNMGPIRGQLPVIIGLFLLWHSLSESFSSFFAALFMGLAFLWEPVLGFFLFISFSLTHLYKIVFQKDNSSRLKLFLAFGAAFSLFLLVCRINFPYFNPLTVIRQIFVQYQPFSEGYANLPQVFPWEALIVFAFYLMVPFMIYKRWITGRFIFNNQELFVLGSVLISFPWVLYAIGRSVDPYFYPLVWTIIPGLAYLLSEYLEKKELRPIIAVAIIIVFLHFNVVNKLTDNITAFVTKYEKSRFDWSVDCVDKRAKGLECTQNPPGQYEDIKAQSWPLILVNEKKEGFDISLISPQKRSVLPLQTFPTNEEVFSDACRRGIPIVSNLDAFIYFQNKCLPEHRFLAFSIISSKDDIDEYVDALAKHETIVFDNRGFPHGLDRVQKRVKNSLIAKGFREVTEIQNMGILSRGFGASSLISNQLNRSWGNWTVKEGVLRQQDIDSPLAQMLVDLPAGWNDFTLSAQVVIVKGSTAGIIFRALDDFRYYVFYLNTDKNQIELWEHQWEGKISRQNVLIKVVESGQLRNGEWNLVKIEVKDNNFRFYLNDHFQAEVAVEKKEGANKIGAWTSTTQAAFKDFVVIQN